MKKSFFTVATLALVVSFLFPSCATILNGSSKEVSIISKPGGSLVTIVNSRGVTVFQGSSPASVRLKSGAGFLEKASYTVKVSNKGYEDLIFPLEYGISVWYFGNLALAGLFGVGLFGALIVDPATGSMWKLETPPVMYCSLKKLTSQNETPTLEVIDIANVPKELKSNLVRIN